MGPDLVVLGNLLVDDLVFADGRTRMAQPGGAVLYAAVAARACGTSVGCVSLLGDDYPSTPIDRLRRLGVDLAGVHPLGRPGVRTWLLYEDQVRRLIHRLGCPTHEQVSPDARHVPEAWWAARAFHLSPMAFAPQRALLQALAGRASGFVSVDPHLPVTEDTIDDWRDALAQADAFFVSEHEVRLDEGAADPRAVLPRLASGRLRFVLLKQGERGGLLYDAHERRSHAWTAPPCATVDPTGAGDAFAMGFVSAHLEGLPVEACLQRAAVVAAVAVEGWGAAALFDLTPSAMEARRRQWIGEEARS
ncbi:MAG: carbohydrate kinase family protein [Acidobacteria bacterium]|nr:carbohydrate kinase family protein [Acidobacteriota bacterium]